MHDNIHTHALFPRCEFLATNYTISRAANCCFNFSINWVLINTKDLNEPSHIWIELTELLLNNMWCWGRIKAHVSLHGKCIGFQKKILPAAKLEMLVEERRVYALGNIFEWVKKVFLSRMILLLKYSWSRFLIHCVICYVSGCNKEIWPRKLSRIFNKPTFKPILSNQTAFLCITNSLLIDTWVKYYILVIIVNSFRHVTCNKLCKFQYVAQWHNPVFHINQILYAGK